MDPGKSPSSARVRKAARLVASCALAVAPLGCDVPRIVGVFDDGSRIVSIPLTQTEDVDVLFVVDTSPSMGPKQERLRAAAASALPLLASRGTLHIAAISADLGAGDKLRDLGCRPGGDGASLAPVGAAAPAGCAAPRDRRAFLEIDALAHESNLPDGHALPEALDCMLAAGAAGCMIQQPLAAARAALERSRDTRDGFLRDGALLFVIFVTDGDDCSLPPGSDLFDPAREGAYGPLAPFRCASHGVAWGFPPRPLPDEPSGGPLPAPAPAPFGFGDVFGRLVDARDYRDFFTRPRGIGGIKPDPNHVILTTLSGPREPFAVDRVRPGTDRTAQPAPCDPAREACRLAVRPACVEAAPGPSGDLFGDPAVRLRFVADAVKNTYPASICAADQRPALADAVRLVEAQRESPGCLPGLLADRAAPACIVEDVIPLGGAEVERRPIPACDDARPAYPCWRVRTDTGCAPVSDRSGATTQQLRIVIERAGAPAPPGSTPEARCALRGVGPG